MPIKTGEKGNIQYNIITRSVSRTSLPHQRHNEKRKPKGRKESIFNKEENKTKKQKSLKRNILYSFK